MSDGLRVAAGAARRIAEGVQIGLADVCRAGALGEAQIEIAGSLRRGTPTVGDIEIVALPEHAPTLLARLDKWVATGAVKKAIYSDGTTRWGEKYRGLIVEGMRVEVFLADADNWGYILWLRTGPGDANRYVMEQLQRLNAPYRPQGGYWHVVGAQRDAESTAQPSTRIRVPDERELFRLLGSAQVIAPGERSLQRYATVLSWKRWASEWTWAAQDAPPVQGSMF